MAFATQDVKYSFVVEDEGGTTSQLEITVPTSVLTNPADMTEFGDEMAALLDALSDGKIEKYNIIIGRYDSAATAASAGSNVEKKGRLLISNALNKTVRLAIPSVLDAVLVASGSGKAKDINTAHADVIALIDALISGLTMASTNVIAPTDSNGQDLIAVPEAYQQHTRSHYTGRRRKG